MINEFKLPELGENIATAQVVKILVKSGDKITKDQSVLEIETDKATVEVPAEMDGIVVDVKIEEGTKVKVGSVVFTFKTEGTEVEAKPEPVKIEKPVEVKAEQIKPNEQPKQTVSTGIVEFKLPELGENIAVATITKVLVNKGDVINKDTTVLEIETDKATVEVPAEVSGTVIEVFVSSGEKAKVGQVIFTVSGVATVEVKKEAVVKVEDKKVEVPTPVFQPQKSNDAQINVAKLTPPIIPGRNTMPGKIAPAAPSVRRFAREIGIDINMVRGSGNSGRISIEDVKAFAKALNEKLLSTPVSAASFGVSHEPLPDFSKWGNIEKVEMSNIRKKTAEHLSYAWNTIPAVTQFDKADITDLENMRKLFGKKVEAKGAKLTVTAILLKIIASAMKVYPQFNSTVDMEKNEIIYKKYYNIGVAVDTDRGLLVPVIKNVDKKNIVELAVELGEISLKARNKKLTIEDMQGGNFSISNLGSIGGTHFTPIVNSPEVAILGVSRSAFEPIYIDGKFEPRLMLPLSLTYDHRIIDGADGARFIRWIVEALQQPFLLSLEG